MAASCVSPLGGTGDLAKVMTMAIPAAAPASTAIRQLQPSQTQSPVTIGAEVANMQATAFDSAKVDVAPRPVHVGEDRRCTIAGMKAPIAPNRKQAPMLDHDRGREREQDRGAGRAERGGDQRRAPADRPDHALARRGW